MASLTRSISMSLVSDASAHWPRPITTSHLGRRLGCKLLEQHLRRFEVRCVEAFGEPAADRREEVAGFVALALVAPEAGEAGGGAKLERFCALLFRDRDRLMVILLGSGSIASGVE